MADVTLDFSDFEIPPRSKRLLTPPSELAKQLEKMIGEPFQLTGKTRTDGSNIRKLVAATIGKHGLPAGALEDSYEIVPPKKKGVPRILREYVDTYTVTTGASYNLQVWNRNPASDSVQVLYGDGSSLLASEVRFVFVRIDTKQHRIRSVAVLSPRYIERTFGKFGKPTMKQQLIITGRARAAVLALKPPILFYPDATESISYISENSVPSGSLIHEAPQPWGVVALDTLRNIVETKLIGKVIKPGATKQRGQILEAHVAELLGYHISEEDLLSGGYPDIRAQALEIKVQDAPTVDLGRFSPEFDEPVPMCPGFTTRSIRYLIALTDPVTGRVEGAVLAPGAFLGKHFTYVADESFKCQRSIPMSFFDGFDGRAVHDP